jgi:hypothetical protein
MAGSSAVLAFHGRLRPQSLIRVVEKRRPDPYRQAHGVDWDRLCQTCAWPLAP